MRSLSGMARWNFRMTTQLVVAGVIALGLGGGAVIFTATQALERATEQQALLRLQRNMNVAWQSLHALGDEARISDGRLVMGTTVLDGDVALVDELQRTVGGVATIFHGDERVATNLVTASGARATGTHLAPGPARDAVLRDHLPFRGLAPVLGHLFYAAYDPIFDRAGQVIGVLFVGMRQADFLRPVIATRDTIMLVSAGMLLLVAAAFVLIGRRMTWQIALRERRLHAANTILDTALHTMANGLCLWSAAPSLLLANARFCEIYDLPPERLRPGLPYRDFITLRHAAGHFGRTSLEEVMREQLAILGQLDGKRQDHLPNGRIVSVVHRRTPDGGLTATYEDVTERHHAEAQIAFMACHDALTRLPNRVLFHERLEQALSRRQGVAMLCLDLDRFKAVNDTFGHAVGDALLCAVAGRLLACVRSADTVARLGGDEFAIIQPARTDPDELARTAERIIESVGRPYELEAETLSIGISVGIGVTPPGREDSVARVLKQADLALYRAKSGGRGTARFFEAGRDGDIVASHALEGELQRALAQQEFAVFYRPHVSLRTGLSAGFEALLRWQHPTRGLIGLAEFMPAAEASGLIGPLGDWLLQRACADATTWPSHLKLAVSLLPMQLEDPGLCNRIRAALSTSRLAADRLDLEIRARAPLLEAPDGVAALQGLMAAGPQIVLDDGALGYASLAFARHHGIRKIKIERSFVDGIGIDPDADAILRSLLGLAGQMKLETLADGVQTAEQLAWLRAAGCHEARGDLFSPACPATAVFDVLGTLAPAAALVA